MDAPTADLCSYTVKGVMGKAMEYTFWRHDDIWERAVHFGGAAR